MSTATQGATAFLAVVGSYPTIVDADRLPELSQRKWWRSPSDGYISCWVNGRRVLLQRVITQAGSGQEAHHRDGLNNHTRAALTVLTVTEHRILSHLEAPPKPGRLKGVYPARRAEGFPQRYHAQIRLGGRLQHLGTYLDPADAGRAVDRARLDYYLGTPGRVRDIVRIALNFPEELDRFQAERGGATC